MNSANVNYRVGIDVGSYSLGMAAIAIDDDGKPTEILSAISLIHDSGVDPDSAKSAATRLATSGIARRTRRLYRRKRKRLAKLDKFISSQGWPLKEFEKYEDPFYPWRVRAELATTAITDQQELGEKLSIALRHIARHRGWRNPYSKVTALYTPVYRDGTIRCLFSNAGGMREAAGANHPGNHHGRPTGNRHESGQDKAAWRE